MANLSSWRYLLKKLQKTGEEKILNLAERGEPGGRHFVQQRLSFPHWSYQTPTMLFRSQDRDLLRDTFKTKQKRLTSQKNRSLFVLEYFLCLN